MTDETVSATTRISASAETVFAVLTDPSRHAAIDGTGRVRDSLDSERLTGSGQIFRVDMYHENHPDGSYEMANQILAFEPPRAISWRPGYPSPHPDFSPQNPKMVSYSGTSVRNRGERAPTRGVKTGGQQS